MIEPHQAQGFRDLGRHLRLRHLAHLKAERDVLGHAHVREQRVALEYQASVALPWRLRSDIAFAEMHAAGRRLDEAGNDAQGRRLAAAGGTEQDEELAVGDVERDLIGSLEVAIALGDAAQPEACHGQTTRPILTKRSVKSMAAPMNRICSTDTAAIVGSIFHSRYCRIAIGSVVRPGPTRNRLISRFPNEAMKPNNVAATIPGKIAGRVMRRNVVRRSAPRLCAASSTARSMPTRLAVMRRTVQGMASST